MIHSRANARLKELRRARRCKNGLALIKGPHLIREALGSGLIPETVLATPSFLDSTEGRSLAAALSQPPIEVEPVLLEELADSDSPRGFVATIAHPPVGVETLPVRADDVYVYLDGVQDPGNLGAIARVAEASGAVALALATGCAHPNHPRALRASAGSLLRLPLAHRTDPEALDAHLTAETRTGPTWSRWTLMAGSRSTKHPSKAA